MSKQFVDFNEYWSYPLQWIYETEFARKEYQKQIYRVDMAMEGRPMRNLYQDELTGILKGISPEDRQAIHKSGCDRVPEGRSYIIRNAVETRANQMSSGVDQYEYQVNDPYMIIDDDTEDLLSAECEQDYINNRLDIMSSTFSRDLTKYGMTAVICAYDQEHEKNIIKRVNPKNVWIDTMYSATGTERFRGYSTMISWDKLKKIIEKEKDTINYNLDVPDKSIRNKNGELDKHIKVGTKKLTDLNDLDIYVEDMNKLATSVSLQGHLTDWAEYDHSLRNCYNLGFYRTFATKGEAQTESGYNGRDVELTVIYDLARKIEFKVINRRFVISANHDAFCRKIVFSIYNPMTDQMDYRVDDFCLDCPLKFQFENAEARDENTYPISPVMTYLDAHDELCAWRAKRNHVTKILATLRILSNGADADSLRRTLNVMGGIYDDIQGDIQTINLAYDFTSIDSEIQYYEDTIKKGLDAYDDFDVMQMMGDRASAAESGMATGAIAQGLATHQNAIMRVYADIARQCIGNRVAYSAMSEFPVTNHGKSSSITIQQMALDAIVRVQPKLAKRAYERTLASNAITLLGTLGQSASPELSAYLLRQAMYGQLPRKVAESYTNQDKPSREDVALAQQQAQNQAEMLKQNETAYENNPVPYEVNNVQQQLSPDETDQLISDLSQPDGGGQATADADMEDLFGGDQDDQSEDMEPAQTDDQDGSVQPQNIDMQGQEGALDVSGLQGLSPESGSQFANPNGNYM